MEMTNNKLADLLAWRTLTLVLLKKLYPEYENDVDILSRILTYNLEFANNYQDLEDHAESFVYEAVHVIKRGLATNSPLAEWIKR